MSKRGFDESQLRKTVVTMIDKDGFNKRSVFEGPTSIGGGLPTPTQDGNALISLNGEWIQQPGYGYSTTELAETLGDFTADDFVGFDDGNGGVDGYYVTIPLTEELTSHLVDLFLNEKEFNVQINDKIYNSKKDKFTYDNGMLPAISLLTDPSDANTTVFSLYVANKTPQVLEFWLPEKPSNSRIYMEETTYTGIDSNLVKCAPFYVDLDDTNRDTNNPSYESKTTFAELDAAIARNAPVFIRFNAYYSVGKSDNTVDSILDTIIMPALVFSEKIFGSSIQTYKLSSLFPASFNLNGVDTNSDFEIYIEFQKDNDFVLIQMYKRERTTRTSIFTNQV